MNTKQPPAEWKLSFKGLICTRFILEDKTDNPKFIDIPNDLVEQLQSEAKREGFADGIKANQELVSVAIEEARADERKKVKKITEKQKLKEFISGLSVGISFIAGNVDNGAIGHGMEGIGAELIRESGFTYQDFKKNASEYDFKVIKHLFETDTQLKRQLKK